MLSGELTFYAHGIFQEVYQNRLKWGHVEPCTDCVGLVALMSRSDIGRKVWVSINDGASWYGPLLVADCAAEADRPTLIQRGWIADLDWPVWIELGLPRDTATGQITFERPPYRWQWPRAGLYPT